MSHIKATNQDNLGWCGEILSNEFHFKDAEQLLINVLHGTSPMCKECLFKIINHLETAAHIKSLPITE
jgi:hypothetical protein